MQQTRRSAGLAAVVALAAAAATCGTALAGPAPAGQQQAAPAPRLLPTSDNPTTTRHTVSLATGEQLEEISSHGRSTFVLRNLGSREAIERLSYAGHDYAVPAAAAPMLGRQLDTALFDASLLAETGFGNNGSRIRVLVQFAAGATPSAPPGITLEQITGSTATGYLTPQSAIRFGRALQREARQEIAHDWKSPLFGNVTSIAYAGSKSAPTRVVPAYPMHILRVTATAADGTPYTGEATVMNTLDTSRFYDMIPIVDGVAQVAVPAGPYSVLATIPTYDESGSMTSLAYTIKDFTVARTAGTMTTVSLDARDAGSPIRVTTPKPANTWYHEIDLFRHARATGGIFDGLFQGYAVDWMVGPDVPVTVTPEAKPKFGTTSLTVNETAAAPDGSYRYNLSFTSDHITANQTYHAYQHQLATVTENFGSDPADTDPISMVHNGPTPGVYGGLSLLLPLVTPTTLTEYFSGGTTWETLMVAPTISSSYQPWTQTSTYRARHDYVANWLRGPLVPGLTADAASCQACIGGSKLTFVASPLVDSAGHTGMPGAATAELQVFQGDTQLYDGPQAFGAIGVSTTPGAGPIRVTYDQDRSAPGVSQYAVTHTEWTFADPAKTDKWVLPDSVCPVIDDGAQCQQVPALSLGYQLHTDLLDEATPGLQTLDLTVRHVGVGDVRSSRRITDVTVQVSFDNGSTWQNATVLQTSRGQYNATWMNRRAQIGTSPALRITATDAAGSSVSQTIDAAYTIHSAS